MTHREKQCLYVLVPGGILLTWRILAIVLRATPAAAEATPLGPPIEGPSAAIAPELAPFVIPTPDTKTPDKHVVYADDPRVLLQQAVTVPQPWTRDPFFSERLARTQKSKGPQLNEETPPAPPWQLTGVSTCNGKLSALLGDQIVKEGTVLDKAYKVIEITSDSVLVAHEDCEYRYRLGEAKPETLCERRTP